MSLTRLKIADVKMYFLLQKDVWDILIESNIQYDILGKYMQGNQDEGSYSKILTNFSLGGGSIDNSFTLPVFSSIFFNNEYILYNLTFF